MYGKNHESHFIVVTFKRLRHERRFNEAFYYAPDLGSTTFFFNLNPQMKTS